MGGRWTHFTRDELWAIYQEMQWSTWNAATTLYNEIGEEIDRREATNLHRNDPAR